MSELLTCVSCKCLVHNSRAVKDVSINVRIGGEQFANSRGDYCRDCITKITIPLGAYIASQLPSDQCGGGA